MVGFRRGVGADNIRFSNVATAAGSYRPSIGSLSLLISNHSGFNHNPNLDREIDEDRDKDWDKE